MATGFCHSDSFVLPFCPLVALREGDNVDVCEPAQEEIDAAQAVAVYRRMGANEANECGESAEFLAVGYY